MFESLGPVILSAMGETAKVIPSVGPPYSITAVFDSRYIAVDHGMEATISERQTTFGYRRIDAPNMRRGDRIECRDASWVVRDIQPDSEDWAVALVEAEDD